MVYIHFQRLPGATCQAFTSAAARLEVTSVGTLVLTAEFPKNLHSAVTVIPFPKNYGTISNEVFILPPSLRPALAHAGTPCGQWITVQFPNAMPE